MYHIHSYSIILWQLQLVTKWTNWVYDLEPNLPSQHRRFEQTSMCQMFLDWPRPKLNQPTRQAPFRPPMHGPSRHVAPSRSHGSHGYLRTDHYSSWVAMSDDLFFMFNTDFLVLKKVVQYSDSSWKVIFCMFFLTLLFFCQANHMNVASEAAQIQVTLTPEFCKQT